MSISEKIITDISHDNLQCEDLQDAITDHDTFKQVSDKHNGKTVITFRVPRSKILAVAKMINRAMADGWELDTQLITNADKSLYFVCSLSK